MIRAFVQTLVVSTPPSPSVLVLCPEEDYGKKRTCRIVPIWVGTVEASQIGLALSGGKPHRPTTHDLIDNLLGAADAKIDRVVVTHALAGTFFTTLFVSLDDGRRQIGLDARPSDSISLAVRQKAPIYLTEKVLDEDSFPFIYHDQNDREELLRFHKMVQDVTPEDFEKASAFEMPSSPDDLMPTPQPQIRTFEVPFEQSRTDVSRETPERKRNPSASASGITFPEHGPSQQSQGSTHQKASEKERQEAEKTDSPSSGLTPSSTSPKSAASNHDNASPRLKPNTPRPKPKDRPSKPSDSNSESGAEKGHEDGRSDGEGKGPSASH